MTNDPVGNITEHLYRATADGPKWKPAMFTLVYTLSGPIDEKFACKVPMWGHAPYWWLNTPAGWITAQRCEVFAWWRRLVNYGTTAEQAMACTLATFASKWLCGV